MSDKQLCISLLGVLVSVLSVHWDKIGIWKGNMPVLAGLGAVGSLWHEDAKVPVLAPAE